jgi:hypothetical protein
MTDDPDPTQRMIFAHVFARVVAKGIQFEPQEPVASISKHSKLCEVCGFCVLLFLRSLVYIS